VYLAEVAEYLLANGHTQALHYVMGQAVTLHILAGKRERGETVRLMGAIRSAQADEKSYKKIVDGLS
jgi:hypothetical protein